jgi:glycosyltransferase involved in cell wall biosynthesis
MNKPVEVCAVMQVPPPVHGQSLMNGLFLGGTYSKILLHHVPMSFSSKLSEVGVFKWSKIFHLFGVVIKICRVRFTRKAHILYYPPAGPNLVPFLRDCIVLCCTRWMFKKTVFHFHANGLCELYRRLPVFLKFLYKLAYHRPDLCICITRLGTEDAKALESKLLSIIPNGLPDEGGALRVRDQPNRPVRILFLSALRMEKGVGTLLEALQILDARKIPFEAVFAGPFSSHTEERVLREKGSAMEAGLKVRWIGEVSGKTKSDAFAGADIFCFPSHYSSETFGLVLVEAMMFSLPVVSTKWRGIPEVVAEGETGFLVPVRDPVALAAKLELLILDPELRASMGLAGRRRFGENFSLGKFRERMQESLALLG